MNKDNLYLKPINLIIGEIESSPSNGIFLVGGEGSGKTTTLLEYIEKSKKTNKPVIDTTLLSIYSIEIFNDIAKLFQVCSILQKMLLYIKANYLKCYVKHFLLFNTKIFNLQNEIATMYNLGNYQIEGTIIDYNIFKNPEILLEEFLDLALKYLKIDNLTIVLDNFDIEKPYMFLYQTYMYNMLKKYLRVVATISDSFVINAQDKLSELSKDNTLIMMNYNRDIETVKKILNNSLLDKQNKNVISKRINFMFSDDTIKELIIRTNGNLSVMILAIKTFFVRIKEYYPADYNKYLLTIVEENLKQTDFVNKTRVRKFYY